MPPLHFHFFTSKTWPGSFPALISIKRHFLGACLSDKATVLLTFGGDEGKDSWGLEWVSTGRMSAARRGFLLYKVGGPHLLREMSLSAGRNLYRQNLECFSRWEFGKWSPNHRNSLSSGSPCIFSIHGRCCHYTLVSRLFFCPLVWFHDNKSCLPN